MGDVVKRNGDLAERPLLVMCLLPLNGKFSNKSESRKILIFVCRLLFCATTLMAALHCWRTRNERSGKHDPAMEVHTHNTHTHTSHV